jgi:long-chain acyl-CoA synthetase
LWIRGPHVFLGYYKEKERTARVVTEDGWLKTGDVVQVMPFSNAFKIIDRVKDNFKMQMGLYVSPSKVE